MKPILISQLNTDHNALIGQLANGGTFTVRALGERLVRVTLRPHSGFKEPRTWAIAPLFGSQSTYGANQNTADVPWEGRRRESCDGFSPISAHTVATVNSATLSTASLSVTLATAPLRLRWRTQDGTVLCDDRETGAYLAELRTGNLRHYVTRTLADRFYGLGDKTGKLNLHGRRLRTIAMDSLGYDPEHGDPLYKHWPFLLTRAESGLWIGTYYDTLATCTFDLGAEHDNYHGLYRYVEIEDGDLDYYVMVGATPGEVVSQWMQLIGGTALPPRWSLGFAQTAMGLADAPDAQTKLNAFIDEVNSRNVPISAFHYGSGYSSRGKRRYVFTWNKQKFPDPCALNAKFHAHRMRTVANVKPCLLDDHVHYPEVAQDGGFLTDITSQAPVVEPFWDGQGAHLDFTNPVTIAWWQNKLAPALLDQGMDAAWNDNNEYAVLDDDAISAMFGQALPIHRSRPLHPLLMTRATYESQKAYLKRHQRDEPTFTVTRAGPPGIQRYAQTWTGDNRTDWRNLKWNIRTGLQMSLSGMFNVGHDVGGFHGPVPSPELFLRWVQACCLNPRMVMNSWKADNVTNLPWMHDSVTAHVLSALRLRYHLLPYLWSLFERASTRHEPIIRPTFYVFPEDLQCYEDCDDFMLGDAMLIAPVVEEGARTRTLYLPKLDGEGKWFDFFTRESFEGGHTRTIPAALEKLPIFVRSGAEIPTAQVSSHTRPSDDAPIAQILTF
jgi:alpha-glucosidase